MIKFIPFIPFILLAFTCSTTKSQNIYSALHLNEEREYKTKRPKKIIKTNIFYNSSGKQTLKEVQSFDESGMFLNAERFDEDGSRTVMITHTNDTINRIVLSSTFENWTKFGHSKELTTYVYVSNKFLIRILTINDNGNILRRTEIKNNDKGHPIEMVVFNESGNSFGKETATYLYDINRVATSVISNDGRILSSDTTMKISFINARLFPISTETYNANGDLINWTSKNFKGEITIYEEEYVYDSFGNCTENRIYKVTVKENGKRKREIDRIFKKEYIY
jgi:hypothetical protein